MILVHLFRGLILWFVFVMFSGPGAGGTPDGALIATLGIIGIGALASWVYEESK